MPPRAELIGGPLDGLVVTEHLEPHIQFIIVPNDRTYTGPFRVHTYRYVSRTGQYLHCGHPVHALPR